MTQGLLLLLAVNLGTPTATWRCDHLPPLDLSHTAKVYCLDLAENVVEFSVKVLKPLKPLKKGKR